VNISIGEHSVKASTKRFAAAAIVASLALAACGGDDDDDSADEPAAEPADEPAAETTMAEEPATETTMAEEPADDMEEPAEEPSDDMGDMGDMEEIDISAASGTLIGAGASSQGAAMANGWIPGFQAVAADATVEYDPIGSGGGREQFLSGGSDFAGSDAALKDDEYEASIDRCAGDQGAINLPHYISPIALPYNLPSIEGSTLNLTPELIAGIFANEITEWTDPAIAEVNPDIEFPDMAINPVHRSDDSGTTENFTDYMSQTAPDIWTYGAIEPWDTDGPGGGEGAPQTQGVVQAVMAGEGSIGYADASQIGDLPAAAVGVAGEFVPFSAEAAGRIVDASERTGGRSEYDFAIEVNRNPETPDTYPIALVSYHIVCLEYDNQETVDLVKAFMTYIGSDEGQAASAAAAGSAPLSPDVQADLAVSVAQITVAE
jgi:phosphate transport system substrate-binding protein